MPLQLSDLPVLILPHRVHSSAREPFHRAMVLLDDMIEVLTVPNDNSGLVHLVVVRYGCRIRATPVDRNLLREPRGANHLLQKGLGGIPIPIRR